jgi:hypothetical protein
MTLDLLKRSEKGSALNASDHDLNFTNIETEVNNKTDIGHGHSSIIFLEAGANEAALIAAFEDARDNDKKIVFAENTTVKIPTMAATIQAACTLVMPTVDVTVLIESGHTIDNVNTLRNGDFSKFRIASEDAEVLVGEGWTAPAFVPPQLPAQRRGVLECNYGVAPVWDIILDCAARADHGMVLFASEGYIKAGKGFRRSRIGNIQVIKGSNLAGESANINNQLVGIVSTDSLQRGIWLTAGSSAACSDADFRNNGTDPSEPNHVAIFVSRGSHAQFDNADCRGSARGIRTARSVVSARASKFDDIPGLVINAFDGNQLTLTSSTFRNCGSVAPNWIMAISSSKVIANNCNFDNAVGLIAYLQSGDATVSLDNCTGANIRRRVGRADSGRLFCKNATFSADPVNWTTGEGEFFTGAVSGGIYLFDTTLDGAGIVPRPGRFVASSIGFFDRVTSTNFLENAIAQTASGAFVYAESSTHNGSTNIMQRGTNVNGETVRHPNGTQECWAWLEVTNFVNGQRMTHQWTFPAAFAISTDTVKVSGTLSSRGPDNAVETSTNTKLKDCQVLASAHSLQLCNLDVEINSAASTLFVQGDRVWIRAHAIGRWF